MRLRLSAQPALPQRARRAGGFTCNVAQPEKVPYLLSVAKSFFFLVRCVSFGRMPSLNINWGFAPTPLPSTYSRVVNYKELGSG